MWAELNKDELDTIVDLVSNNVSEKDKNRLKILQLKIEDLIDSKNLFHEFVSRIHAEVCDKKLAPTQTIIDLVYLVTGRII